MTSSRESDATRPVVAITVSLDAGARIRKGHDYVYLKQAYPRAVQTAGGLPWLVTPELEVGDVLQRCDAVLIPGGDDLPTRWDAAAPTQPEHPERIRFERSLLDAAVECETPVLGVCYGMQLINLHFGGSLFGDLARERAGSHDHGGSGRSVWNQIDVHGPGFLDALGSSARVSCSHHQAIDQLAPGFRIAAVASDGVPEAIERGNLLGVEWHPEADDTASGVYAALVGRARRRLAT